MADSFIRYSKSTRANAIRQGKIMLAMGVQVPDGKGTSQMFTFTSWDMGTRLFNFSWSIINGGRTPREAFETCFPDKPLESETVDLLLPGENRLANSFICPKCKGPLGFVSPSSSSYLNRDQFDSQKAGDYFCKTCKGDRGGSGYRYYWESELIASSPYVLATHGE